MLDTGSTDGTQRIARDAGCIVEEKSFTHVFSEEEALALNFQFVAGNDKPITKAGDKIFDFSAARNYAASLSPTDMVACPDCDEIFTKFDLEAINAAITQGVQRFEYDFVFSHDDQGRPLIQFMHSKFYDRRVFKWVRIVHEVLEGSGKSLYMPSDLIKLEHWQNPGTDRGQYLTGLAWDCYTDRKSDRNSHYFARELYFTGRYRSALQEFHRHVNMNAWHIERAQSMVYMGRCWEAIGNDDEAIGYYQSAFNLDSSRREALLALALVHNKRKNYEACAAYAHAALVLPYRGYYCDDKSQYRDVPHRHLYYALYYMGQKAEAQDHWRAALTFCPEDPQLLHDARFFLNLPHVTIVIPTLGREDRLAKCLELIHQNANYPSYDVLVKPDKFGPENRGAIALLNEGVDEAKGHLVMYLSNDCEPQPGFLIQAALAYVDGGRDFVALNDGIWGGKLATHWLAPKHLRDFLPEGKFFFPGYSHHGCDNELTAQMKARGIYSYAERARVNHLDRPDEISQLAWQHVQKDRDLLARRLKNARLLDPVGV